MRSRFQLPLILKQRGFVDVTEDLSKVVVLADANAPERRFREVGSVANDGAALGKNWSRLFVNSSSL